VNDKVDVEIFRRRLTVEIEGLTPIEISSLAQKVDEKIREISEQNEKIADSSKLAVLAALAYAAELAREKEGRETERLFFEKKIEELSRTLESALSAAGAAS